MKKKHYIVQVGSQEIKIWAEDSDKAIEKAKADSQNRITQKFIAFAQSTKRGLA